MWFKSNQINNNVPPKAWICFLRALCIWLPLIHIAYSTFPNSTAVILRKFPTLFRHLTPFSVPTLISAIRLLLRGKAHVEWKVFVSGDKRTVIICPTSAVGSQNYVCSHPPSCKLLQIVQQYHHHHSHSTTEQDDTNFPHFTLLNTLFAEPSGMALSCLGMLITAISGTMHAKWPRSCQQPVQNMITTARARSRKKR